MISVITPCLDLYSDNRTEYFEKMMESIHGQTYTDIEHIIVDGESSDGTLELLVAYQKHGWVNTLITEKDSGVYEALNKGISCSNGEYIQIMNTDDYFIDRNYFKKCIDALEKKEIDFVHANKIIESKYDGSESVKRGDESVAFFKMPFRHQTMVVRRGIFTNTITPFDTSYEIAADYKFVIEMLMRGKKGRHFTDIVLRSRSGGLSSNREKCIQEVSRVLYECYGNAYNLTIEDCVSIYTQNISADLFTKIQKYIQDPLIVSSLRICYEQSQKQYHTNNTSSSTTI